MRIESVNSEQVKGEQARFPFTVYRSPFTL